MTIHRHFVILSATSAVPANDNERRIVRQCVIHAFRSLVKVSGEPQCGAPQLPGYAEARLLGNGALGVP